MSPQAALPAPPLARRLRYEVRTALAGHPGVYLPLRRFLKHGLGRKGGNPVGRDTEVVIEGFQRSANSFALHAFLLAQGRPVRTGDHLHASSQVAAAVRWGIPTLLLIRAPEDAALSLVQRNRGITLSQALRAHAMFHEEVLPHRAGVVVARFETVTSDFGLVVDALNARFGTGFRRFDHTEEHEAAVFARIEDHHEGNLDGGRDEAAVARPSELRKRRKEELQEALRDPALDPVRERARKAYETLARQADV